MKFRTNHGNIGGMCQLLFGSICRIWFGSILMNTLWLYTVNWRREGCRLGWWRKWRRWAQFELRIKWILHKWRWFSALARAGILFFLFFFVTEVEHLHWSFFTLIKQFMLSDSQDWLWPEALRIHTTIEWEVFLVETALLMQISRTYEFALNKPKNKYPILFFLTVETKSLVVACRTWQYLGKVQNLYLDVYLIHFLFNLCFVQPKMSLFSLSPVLLYSPKIVLGVKHCNC